jgi:hypothetical protein
MQEKDISIWKAKVGWIAERGGMVLLNTHSDYMQFDGQGGGPETYPSSLYVDLLSHIATEYKDQYWNALPAEVSAFWRAFSVGKPGGATESMGDPYQNQDDPEPKVMGNRS